jgi:nucleoside-diphosphate-sugar epimerase
MLVTGAAGFIGAAVVEELLRREHRAIALVRSVPPPRWSELRSLELMSVDLRASGSLDLREADIDVVLHLAAATTGPAARQLEDTVTATVNLLSAARAAGIRRVVGISSIAVLDYRSLQPFAVVDEDAPLAGGTAVGVYAAAKIRQERLFRDFAQQQGNSCTILRPGLVYDTARLAAAHAGIVRKGVALLASHRGTVPTVELHGLAAAIVSAAESNLGPCEVIHLVDDNLPTQSEYIVALRRRGLLPRNAIAVPWRAMQGLAWLADAMPGAAGFRDKLPEIVLPGALATRLKPFRFSNAKAKRLLAWVPAGKFA